MRRFRAKQTDQGKRADVLVAERLPKFSRSSLKGLFKRGLVKQGGKEIKSGHKINAAETVTVDTAPLEPVTDEVSLPVIYEDDDVVVMDKPAGLLTHSKGALNLEATVASFLNKKLTDKSLEGNRAGIVHRLDRPTSGVIIGAKHAGALKHLQKQFSTRKVKKTYWAIAEGWPKPIKAMIVAPIGRDPKRPQTFKVMASGKPAQTEYKVLKTFKKAGQEFSLLELKPLTGRTHQIRVHLAYIGHALAGDPVYSHRQTDQPLRLHAKSLELTLPNGERRKFEASLPREFKDYIS